MVSFRGPMLLALVVLASIIPGSNGVHLTWFGSGSDLGILGDIAPRSASGTDTWADLAAQGEPLLCILDSGVDAEHVDLAGRIVAWRDFVHDQPRPYDDSGHGTHVSGIAAGSGAAQAEHRGVAPHARLAVGKVMDAHGHGTVQQALDGIAWCTRLGAGVINVSLEEDDCGPDAVTEEAVRDATEAGALVVVAAGNRGAQSCALHAPANVPQALTVGALDGPTLEADAVARFSGQGAPGQGKPDLVAPGRHVVAPAAGTHDAYRSMDGTSMAAPFVTGVAALLRAASPGASPADIARALRDTARSPMRGWDPAWGYGAVDPAAALETLQHRFDARFHEDAADRAPV